MKTLHFPGIKLIPCVGNCGWDVPVFKNDNRSKILCHDCDPETRDKPLRKCDCDGCNFGTEHNGVWSLN